MQPNPPPVDQSEPHQLTQIAPDDPTSSSLFDWSDFLDFSIDESLNVTFTQSESQHPGIDQTKLLDGPGGAAAARVRKRDPRLVCSNFLAGRIPCACPELDEKLEEEGYGLPGRKRSRTARVSSGFPIRCQVPDCEADISELKGYHRRHRVCLRCANATAVVLDGENKRYCQQCGKFHILSDFDEGKRSCRRKLERHNNRRRRKPHDSKEGMEKELEPQQLISADCASGDDEAGKDRVSVSSQFEEREMPLDSDGHNSTPSSHVRLQNPQTDGIMPLAATDEVPANEDKQHPTYKNSPSDYDNKSTYSSLCPSGRISFKLYDWNPAEFPRRLRHQIFQWLASMPVELEGYIRPGCTILTAFIAMPKSAWHKLLEEPALYINRLVSTPGSLLSGRDTMHVYLNDMIFRVTRDATSIVEIKVKAQAPKLHYIYPTCFEVGRPMEFVACGSNLLQPNFRFLISLAGQYLAYNISVSSLNYEGRDANEDHQLLKIHVPRVNVDLLGPAFIEVENQSGLSNFVPIFVGAKETCVEMSILLQQFGALPSQEEKLAPPMPSEVCALRHSYLSDFILDAAWLLRKPVSQQLLTSTQMRRLNNLLVFLIEKESSVILEKVLCSLKYSMDNNLLACVSDSEKLILWRNMDIARCRLGMKSTEEDFLTIPAESGTIDSRSSQNQGFLRMVQDALGLTVSSPPPLEEVAATVPLLKRDTVIMNVNIQNRPQQPCSPFSRRRGFTLRPLVLAFVAVAVCFTICAIVLHPQRANQIATFVRSRFSDSS